MSRTIKEIYNESIQERNKRMELAEFSSDSKLSILNGITWTVAAVIYSFETILDVFAIDISTAINSRINGTPIYYANALLQYQKGDTLTVREDGLAFGYASVDESKRIITQVSYQESTNDMSLDSKLIMKVATGQKGNLSEISADELLLINAYISKLAFVGTKIEVVSRKGDILIPCLSVYYDGAVLESEIYDAIEEKLNEYIMDIDFDAGIYVSKVIDTIKKVEHVTDVHIDSNEKNGQGVFIACYDSDGYLGETQKIERMSHTSSGYIRQSTRQGEEKLIPGFREAIKLIIDNGCDTNCLQTN